MLPPLFLLHSAPCIMHYAERILEWRQGFGGFRVQWTIVRSSLFRV